MTDPYTILRAFVAAYKGDAIADSDLDDEQPRTITVTLGDIRRAERALRMREARAKMKSNQASSMVRAALEEVWHDGYTTGRMGRT